VHVRSLPAKHGRPSSWGVALKQGPCSLHLSCVSREVEFAKWRLVSHCQAGHPTDASRIRHHIVAGCGAERLDHRLRPVEVLPDLHWHGERPRDGRIADVVVVPNRLFQPNNAFRLERAPPTDSLGDGQRLVLVDRQLYRIGQPFRTARVTARSSSRVGWPRRSFTLRQARNAYRAWLRCRAAPRSRP